MFSLFTRRRNPGTSWLDAPDAARVIARKARAGEITHEEAVQLEKYADEGYFKTRIELSADEAAAIDRDVERLWREKPRNLSFAYDSPPLRFSDSIETLQRRPRYRIHELHATSPVAMRLVLHPALQRWATLILGETAIATQSLYFEFGSQQPLHRDSTVVPTPEFGRLLASWIALEDIAPESGPLAYVPGSHRFPFYAFRPGEYLYDPTRHTAADVEAAVRFYTEQLERSHLPIRHFEAKRGEVLIWHAALMHGGAMPASPERSRKSLVVHYSTRRSQTSRLCAVSEEIDGVRAESVFETTEIVERDGAYTFGNPLEGRFLHRR